MNSILFESSEIGAIDFCLCSKERSSTIKVFHIASNLPYLYSTYVMVYNLNWTVLYMLGKYVCVCLKMVLFVVCNFRAKTNREKKAKSYWAGV